MDITSFESSLRSDGYQDVESKAMAAGTSTPEHSHPFDVRALVIEGQITLSASGASKTYAKGDVFDMAAGCRHSEEIGTDGVRYVVGRRRGARA